MNIQRFNHFLAVVDESNFRRAAASTRRPVRIGIVSVALWDALPRLVEAAQEAKIPIHLEQATTNEQLRALAEGGLDLALVAPPFEAPRRLQVTRLGNEPVVAVLPAGLAPNDKGPVPLDVIADRLILFPRADGPALYDAIFAMFRTRGLIPTIIQESPRMLTTLALVAAGAGASLVPAAISRNISVIGLEFRALDLGEEAPTWPIALAHMPLSARSDAAMLLSHWQRDCRAPSRRRPRERRR
jgi:DNA-binding transcriptional LysR family regulator